jgi:Uma2 family endonuclease
MAVRVVRRSFTVEEYYRMAEAGILSEDDRVELLEGEIVEMPPIGSRHASSVDRLTQLFAERVRHRAILRVQNPVRLGPRTEPQPDLALLRPRPDFYAQAHPGPQDVFLIVEVGETSADFDREIKVPLYARAGVPEVWLLDLGAGHVEVYREPTAQGYRDVHRLQRGQRLAPEAFPDLDLAVDEILG